MFVVFVMTFSMGRNAVLLQQHRAGAGVLRQDQIHFAEHLHSPEGHVVEIAYGRRYDEKFRHFFLSLSVTLQR